MEPPLPGSIVPCEWNRVAGAGLARVVRGGSSSRRTTSRLARGGHLRAPIGDRELHFNSSIRWHGNLLGPFYWIGEDGPLDADLGHDIVQGALAGNLPAFVPSLNLVIARRNVGELEVAIFVSHRIIGMAYDEHLGVHPCVTGVAAKVDE